MAKPKPVPPNDEFRDLLENVLKTDDPSTFNTDLFQEALFREYDYGNVFNNGYIAYLKFSDCKLVAAVLLDEDKARQFLLSKTLVSRGAWDNYLVCLCLKRLGYNPSAIVETTYRGEDARALYEAFLQDERIEVGALKKLARVVMGTGSLVVENGKIKVNPSRLPKLLSRVYSPVFGMMSPAMRQEIQTKLAHDFERVVVPHNFGLSQEMPATHLQSGDSKKLITIFPAGHAASYIAPEGRYDTYQGWLYWLQGMLEANMQVEALPPSRKFVNREIFIRDKYILIDGVAYIPNPDRLQDSTYDLFIKEHGQFKKDAERLECRLQDVGAKTEKVDGWFEGGNVVVDPKRKVIIAGHRDYAEKEAGEKLLAAVQQKSGDEWTLLSVPQAREAWGDEILYHMDLALSDELAGGHRLFCPEITKDENAIKEIRALYGDMLIEVPLEEARSGAVNLVENRGVVLLSVDAPETTQKLRSLGYKVIAPTAYGLETGMVGAGGDHCGTNYDPRVQPI